MTRDLAREAVRSSPTWCSTKERTDRPRGNSAQQTRARAGHITCAAGQSGSLRGSSACWCSSCNKARVRAARANARCAGPTQHRARGAALRNGAQASVSRRVSSRLASSRLVSSRLVSLASSRLAAPLLAPPRRPPPASRPGPSEDEAWPRPSAPTPAAAEMAPSRPRPSTSLSPPPARADVRAAPSHVMSAAPGAAELVAAALGRPILYEYWYLVVALASRAARSSSLVCRCPFSPVLLPERRCRVRGAPPPSPEHALRFLRLLLPPSLGIIMCVLWAVPETRP